MKFTSRGSVEIQVAFTDAGVGPSRLSIKIVDTGAGLSPKQTARLFEPFSQGDNSTTRKFGGSGLGLILSRRLARALGGDVTLQSTTEGRGSTFAIEIAVERDARRATRLQKPAVEMKRLDGVKILVVEDSPDNQNLLELLLAKAGAFVQLANNGREGVEAALKGSFDVVLMDIQMPVLGCNAHLSKPINPAMLTDTVASIVAENRSRN